MHKLRNWVCSFAAVTVSVSCAGAGEMTLDFTDTFTSADALYLASGTPAPFSGNTPFRVVSTFDPGTPVFHLPGFNAYAPLSPTATTLTVAGQSYYVSDADVSIFDPSNPFSPGLYAAGFIQNPAADQEGFVQDYSGASPSFTVSSLVPTTFVHYNGTGFQPGSGIPPGCAATDSCTGNNNTPLHLTSVATGAAYLLTTGARDSGPVPAGTAALFATPEPGTIGLLVGGLLLIGTVRRNRGR